MELTMLLKAGINLTQATAIRDNNGINVEIGYQPGDKLNITKARLYDFSWSYNADNGTYSCTGKCIGPNSKSGVAGALKVKPSPNKATHCQKVGCLPASLDRDVTQSFCITTTGIN